MPAMTWTQKPRPKTDIQPVGSPIEPDEATEQFAPPEPQKIENSIDGLGGTPATREQINAIVADASARINAAWYVLEPDASAHREVLDQLGRDATVSVERVQEIADAWEAHELGRIKAYIDGLKAILDVLPEGIAARIRYASRSDRHNNPQRTAQALMLTTVGFIPEEIAAKCKAAFGSKAAKFKGKRGAIQFLRLWAAHSPRHGKKAATKALEDMERIGGSSADDKGIPIASIPARDIEAAADRYYAAMREQREAASNEEAKEAR